MDKKRSLIPQERIEKSILLIRGQKVILDRDLADLYGVETRVMKQAVRRNIKRFPNDFMFELSKLLVLFLPCFFPFIFIFLFQSCVKFYF